MAMDKYSKLEHLVPCPNKCEVGTVPHCDVDKHRAMCPLEPVACEFADVGCNVKVARQHLSRHMEESQQQHLLSATLLNLRLTKATIAEKDHQLAEQSHQQTGSFMKVHLQHGVCSESFNVDWPVTFIVTLQLFNQLSDHDHYIKNFECTFSTANFTPNSVHTLSSTSIDYIAFRELYRRDKAVQYLMDDCLKFCMWIRIKSSQ